MTVLGAPESLLEKVADERTTIESQMRKSMQSHTASHMTKPSQTKRHSTSWHRPCHSPKHEFLW